MAVVAPLSLNDIWSIREATIVGKSTEAVFAPFARHTDLADFVFVHGAGAEPVIMLSSHIWKRVLATVAVASGEPAPIDKSR
jgi:hypothetical protein